MTEIVVREDAQPPAPSIAQFIQRIQPEIARALPRGMDADRLARLALTVVRQSDMEARKAGKPENSLANCSVESFGGALLTAAALGLEPGVNQEAYLVPYKGECTLIVGYQGLAKLFWQHPLAKHLDAHAVHANDQFEYGYGLDPYLNHQPAKGERGKITHYYAVAKLSTGASSFVVLTAEEVKALRGGKVGPSGKIPDPQHWMERKTALRQLVKLLPKSTQLAAALAIDEQSGQLLADRGVATAIADGDSMPALPPIVYEREPEDRVTAAEIIQQTTEPPVDWDAVQAAHDAALEAETITGDESGSPQGFADPPEQPRTEPMSRPQMQKLQALLTELGARSSEKKHAVVGQILDREIATMNAVTKQDATVLIDTLDQMEPDNFRQVFAKALA